MKLYVDYDFNTKVNFPVYRIGYCKLGSVLSLFQPLLYNSNEDYGWMFDVYVFSYIKTFAICTGYSPVGKTVPNILCEKYEKKARQVLDSSLPYEVKQTSLIKMIYDLAHDMEEM